MSKTTRFPEDGYCVAPFFADSAPIARSLLKMAVSFASADNPRHNIVMDIPVDYNLESVSIPVNEHEAKPVLDLLNMRPSQFLTY